jgi:hypothetical protein
VKARDLVNQAKAQNQARKLTDSQKKELLEVIAHNDTLGAHDSAKRVSKAKTIAMLESLGYTLTEKALDRVCVQQLGRKGFTQS